MWQKASDWWSSLDQKGRRYAMVAIALLILAGMYFAAHYGLFAWVPGLLGQ